MLTTKPITVAGLTFNSAYTKDNDRCWVTLSSVADAVGANRQDLKNFLRANPSCNVGIDVQVGKYKSKGKAYPIAIAVEYLKYRAGKLGDVRCQALLDAIVIADIERTVKEEFGVVVSAKKHEENRLKVREEVLERLLADYTPGTWLSSKERDKAGLTPLEDHVACERAYQADKRAKRDRYEPGTPEYRELSERIRLSQEKEQKLYELYN